VGHDEPGATFSVGEAESPLDKLPEHIRRVTRFGQRADWSHDGRRILFIEKTFGDVYEIELETGIIRPMTHNYFHEGYTRALYLSNGDILLSGARQFDAGNPWVSRSEANAELWVLKKDLSRPPAPLGQKCSEGPAVSRKRMHIVWTQAGSFYSADIVYEEGWPKLANRKKVLDKKDLPFQSGLETQSLRPPAEKELIFSAYGYQGTEVCGLNLRSGKIVNYSMAPGQYDEPEGIFPDGKHTLVECDKHSRAGVQHIDIYKLALDGSGRTRRMTFFSDYPGYKASNPVVSDDGRYIAFQVARRGDSAGVGRGIFIFDIEKFEARPKAKPAKPNPGRTTDRAKGDTAQSPSIAAKQGNGAAEKAAIDPNEQSKAIEDWIEKLKSDYDVEARDQASKQADANAVDASGPVEGRADSGNGNTVNSDAAEQTVEQSKAFKAWIDKLKSDLKAKTDEEAANRADAVVQAESKALQEQIDKIKSDNKLKPDERAAGADAKVGEQSDPAEAQTDQTENDVTSRANEEAAEKAAAKTAEQSDAVAAWIDEFKSRYEVEPAEQVEGNGGANIPEQSEAAETLTGAEKDDEPEGDEPPPEKADPNSTEQPDAGETQADEVKKADEPKENEETAKKPDVKVEKEPKTLEERIERIETRYGVKVHHKYNAGKFFPAKWLREPISGQGHQMPKEEVERTVRVVEKFLAAYPKAMLRKNLTDIYLISGMKFYGKGFGAAYGKSALYINNEGKRKGYTEEFLLSQMHSELSSIFLINYGGKFPREAWEALNVRGWQYNGTGVEMLGQKDIFAQNDVLLSRGFLVKYSQSSLENDVNMFAFWAFTRADKLAEVTSKYVRISDKYRLFVQFYKDIDPGINIGGQADRSALVNRVPDGKPESNGG